MFSKLKHVKNRMRIYHFATFGVLGIGLSVHDMPYYTISFWLFLILFQVGIFTDFFSNLERNVERCASCRDTINKELHNLRTVVAGKLDDMEDGFTELPDEPYRPPDECINN